ncbi:MAG TPA: oxidoreductase-like domain-containing protein [Rhodanobacteraceae bacterium]|nr:oxidoreductase-like domain-containing protein [Rhodanobacteraceae bacterium]
MKATAQQADPRPRAPVEPDAEECCGEGCVRCVYDIYEQKLERYKAALAAWQARHAAEAEPASSIDKTQGSA